MSKSLCRLLVEQIIKIMKRIYTIAVLLFLVCKIGYADSPLTSTDFYRAYLDIPIVKSAAANPGKLSHEQMAYLLEDRNPLDVRLALINAVGWNIDGLTTFTDYLAYSLNNYPKEKHGHPADKIVTTEDLFSSASPQQMAVLVYLRAMSDYLNVSQAYQIADMAMQNSISSESFMLPMALVWAQLKLMQGEWEAIYPSFEYLFLNAQEKDMRPEAVKIIMDYIGEYKKYSE